MPFSHLWKMLHGNIFALTIRCAHADADVHDKTWIYTLVWLYIANMFVKVIGRRYMSYCDPVTLNIKHGRKL